jgi:hypothetical protein
LSAATPVRKIATPEARFWDVEVTVDCRTVNLDADGFTRARFARASDAGRVRLWKIDFVAGPPFERLECRCLVDMHDGVELFW